MEMALSGRQASVADCLAKSNALLACLDDIASTATQDAVAALHMAALRQQQVTDALEALNASFL